MNKRQENALKTRQKLLDTTHDLIKEKGFYRLNIEDITNRANVAKGTFYIYFKHKEEIVFELCKNLFAKTALKLDNIKNSSVYDKLSCCFECFVKEVFDYQIHIVREWMKGVVDKNLNDDSMGIIKWKYDIEIIKKIISEGVNNKELKADTPVDRLSEIILCTIYGMFTCWCMSDGIFDPEKAIKDFCDIQLKTIINQYKIKGMIIHTLY